MIKYFHNRSFSSFQEYINHIPTSTMNTLENSISMEIGKFGSDDLEQH